MKNFSAVVILCISCSMVNAAGWTSWTDKNVAVPTPAKYESFEDGAPKTWQIQGSGKFSINPWHYKLGKKSLQWDFKAGDIIRINNTIGNPNRRGLQNNGCYSSFCLWIYSPKPLKNKQLRFEFRTGKKTTAYFDFALNYKGWQFGSVCYHLKNFRGKTYLHGNVSEKTDNILIKAPKDIDGTIMFDLVVYNGPRYWMFRNILPNPTPWIAPSFDTAKYPVPKKVNNGDREAIKRIKNTLLCPIIITKTTSAEGTKRFKGIMKVIDFYKIVEDEHGIRGTPINLGRQHGGGGPEYMTFNGISPNDVTGYKFGTGQARGFQATHKNSILLRVFAEIPKALAAGLTQEQFDKLSVEIVKVWKFLIDQSFNTSYGYNTPYPFSYLRTLYGIYPTRKALYKAGLMPELFQYSQYSKNCLFTTGEMSMDYYFITPSLFYLVFLYSEDVSKQIQVLRYLRDRLSREITTVQGYNGFKPDGCGYHGTSFAVDYFKQGFLSICKVAYAVSNSSFALSDAAYNRLKKVAMCLYFYSNNVELPIFMQGTHVLSRHWERGYFRYEASQLPGILRYLALAGKNGCDKELAQAYVNLKHTFHRRNVPYFGGKYDSVFEKKYGIKPSAPPRGNISMPYAPLVAQRRGDWVAIAWGGGNDMRQRGNHYGYWTVNGPLSILGKKGFHGSGTEEFGWDWNRVNGATNFYIPELSGIKLILSGRKPLPENVEGLKKADKWYQQFRKTDAIDSIATALVVGNGGISWRGTNGCFKKIFGPNKLLLPCGGIKTYFFINDRIYALGSNITSWNKKYPLQTNLYQKALYESKIVYPNKKTLKGKAESHKLKDTSTYIDGKKITACPVPDTELAKNKAHHLIDPQGSGYYVPAGQDLFVARKHQKGRTSNYWKHYDHEGDFATAWLNHGIGCKDAKYCYVVMPYCDKSKFAKFSGKNFEILRQDGFAHILHDKIDNFYAGIFFRGGKVTKLPYVENVERACQIMYRKQNGKLEIVVGDPATHRKKIDNEYGRFGGKSLLKMLKVTFTGKWKLQKPVDGVKLISSDKNKTVIEFACIHGKDFNFTLTK